MKENRTEETDAKGRDASFMERLAEKMGVAARATTVYGAPIERNGVTIVPVAKVAYGFGGGAGGGSGNHGERGEGSGGGGGVRVTPLGYIEIVGEGSNFKPIFDPSMRVAMIVAGGLAGMFILRGLRKLLPPRTASSEA
jgi:uncharacterized spore protein YtfJ